MSSRKVNGIQGLPFEMINHLASVVNLEDLSNLRLSCRDVAVKSLPMFANRCFSTKEYMPSHESLKMLLSVSKTVHIGHYVTTVIITTCKIPELGRNRKMKNRTEEYYASQQLFVRCGGLYHTLAEAFRSLPRLRRIEVRTYGGLHTHTGIPVKILPEALKDPSFSSTVTTCILTAIQAAAIPVHALSFRGNSMTGNFTTSAFVVTDLFAPLLSQTLRDLSSLHLDLQVSTTEQKAAVEEERLARFLRCTSNLERFSLAFTGSRAREGNILGRLRDIRLTRLRHLALRSCHIDEQNLLEFLSRFRTHLTGLELHSIVLSCGTPWTDAFRHMRDDLSLRELSFHHLKYFKNGRAWNWWFGKPGCNFTRLSDLSTDVEYAGFDSAGLFSELLICGRSEQFIAAT